MIAAEAYIRRETTVGVVISLAITLLFFLIVFGFSGPVEIWGAGEFVFDFLPQAFMIALMATLIPGLVTERKIRQGELQMIAERSILPKSLPFRAVLIAITAAAVSVALFSGVFLVSGVTGLGWLTALAIKLIFGGALAAIVTPLGLKAALSSR